MNTFLLTLVFTPVLHATSIAEVSYKLLVGDCPKSETPATPTEASAGIECDGSESCAVRAKALSKDAGEISENAYLGSLAMIRAEGLACSIKQVQRLAGSEAARKEFTDDIVPKIQTLIHARHQWHQLQPNDGTIITSPETQKLEMLMAQVEASIPFYETPQMKSAIARLEHGIGTNWNGIDSEYTKKAIAEKMPKALKEIGKALIKETGMLAQGGMTAGKSLSWPIAESLAQDKLLVEAFHQRNLANEATLKPIACRVDAKYGKGAEIRDNAVSLATTLGAVASMGLGAASKGLMMMNAARATTASVTLARTAGAFATLAGATGQLTVMKNTAASCFSSEAKLGTNAAATCKENIVEELKPHNCFVNASLSVLGGVGGYMWAKKFAQIWKQRPLSESAVAAAEAGPVAPLDGGKVAEKLTKAIREEKATPAFAVKNALPEIKGEANVRRVANAIEENTALAPAVRSELKNELLHGAAKREILTEASNPLHAIIERVPADRREQIADVMAKLTKSGETPADDIVKAVAKSCAAK